MSAGIVGLTLTYAKMLTGGFQWCVRQSAEVENLVCGTILSFLTSVFFRRRMLQKSYVVFSAIRGTDEIGSPKGTVTGSYFPPTDSPLPLTLNTTWCPPKSSTAPGDRE